MMYRDSDSRAPVTPQLSLRVAVMGGVALVMFGVIFFRLWSLQVLSGPKYRAEADNNRVREITVQAPRGRVVDRNGQLLVDNRAGYAVELDPAKMPKDSHQRSLLYIKLGRILQMRPRDIRERAHSEFLALKFAKATIKQDVSAPVYQYLLENQDKYPGVTVEQVFLRLYPRHQVGAQLFGTVGRITGGELKQKEYRGVPENDRVGQSGLEYSYDRYLRGLDGADRVQVDSEGNLKGEISVRAPTVGHQLKLSLDYNVEQAGQNAIASDEAAFVAMDVHTGEVIGMGSNPSFDPNAFAKSITESDYKALTSDSNGAPILNRAIQGLYPTGSTFKLITSTAALQSGLSTPDTVIDDPGQIQIGNIVFQNAGHAANGAIGLLDALRVSSDVYFYSLGAQLNNYKDHHQLQEWAGKLGLGHHSGIDLPQEYKGLVPSPEWRNALYRKLYKQDPNCLQNGTCRPWSIGDNVNLAVGQGDVEVTPLQLATAYATIANGGTVVRPHLGLDVEDAAGRVLQELSSPPVRHLNIDPTTRGAILTGLHMAADTPGGTSYPVFKDFPIPIAGKTGTAQKGGGRPDQSWYVALAPYPDPKYVVAATFEHGGFGVQTAAPAVAKILAVLLNVHLKAGQASGGTPSGVNLYG